MNNKFFFLLIIYAILTSAGSQGSPAKDASPTGETWMKVTLKDGYERPVQIHIFADRYRPPWYAHYALTRDNLDKGYNPAPQNLSRMLKDGESSGWVNISEMIYPHSRDQKNGGARLVIYPAYTYWNPATAFHATIEFAPSPSDDAIVKTFNINYSPSTINIILPPNLDAPENIVLLRSDIEIGKKIGEVADSFNWPQYGTIPSLFPFFISANIASESMNATDAMDRQVIDRELKTLSNFGFNGIGADPFFEQYGYKFKSIGGVGWYMDKTFSAPDLDKISKKADEIYRKQIEQGLEAESIAFAMVIDEPLGEDLQKMSNDPKSVSSFKNWLKSLNLTPSDLLVNSWDEVKIVTDSEMAKFPALYYYSQKYRTVALGNFIAIQKRELHEHWKKEFPVVANFSDGAIYYGNFYGQGVDYFTLLHETDQNALWSEDWSNLASTYQHSSYNTALMQAAARKYHQTLGHYLIAYAGRKGYDIRLKAVSEVARGVKILESFAYGPMWSSHEKSTWQQNFDIWYDHASVVREIGSVENLLIPAMPRKAEVALLYSSASDIWNLRNQLYGFERMNTWLALTHAQIPVDIVHESEVSDGILEGYKVLYLSDPNITRESSSKIVDWVKAGGTLVMTAGSGERDEYNRPFDKITQLLPYSRKLRELEVLQAPGRFLSTLKTQGTVKAGDTLIDIIGSKSIFEDVTESDTVNVLSVFENGNPSEIRSTIGRGYIIDRGYLPAISYMRSALLAKGEITEMKKKPDTNNGIPSPDDEEPSSPDAISVNPWQYSVPCREHIIQPVRNTHILTPIKCNVPLVDAVYMTSDKGIVIPLANYTLQPIKDLELEILIEKPFTEIRSVHQGLLNYERISDKKVRVRLPLDCTDFLTISYS